MYKRISNSIFIVYSLLFIVLPLIAAARIVPECRGGPCELCDFFLLIANIFDFIAFKLAPPVAGFFFLLAGLLFLVSGGSEERVSQAKKIFINAFIGLIFIYVSWLIVGTLITIIGKGVEGFTPESSWSPATWNKFKCQ